MSAFKGLLVLILATSTAVAVLSSSLDFSESKDSWNKLNYKKLRSRTSDRDLQVTEPHTIRISTGATESWVDDNGRQWESDNLFTNKGAIHSICPLQIANTTLDSLYCKERYFNKWVHPQPFRYDLAVPRNGAYAVRLHFAEIHYKASGERVFDVWVGGKLAINSLDIYDEVGFATAFTIPIITKAINNAISIELVPRIENPKICAIEIIELTDYVEPPTLAPVALPNLPFSTRISAGAAENWIDDYGTLWESDKYFGDKGAVHSVCPKSINGTDLDSLYCKERYFNKWQFSGPYRYDIPVPKDGAFSVKLHFAELSYRTTGARVFDVLVGGKVVAKNFDIVKEAGFLTALVIPIVTLSTNRTIGIEFVSKLENPKISAIEVEEIPNYSAPPTLAPVSPENLPFVFRISAGATENWVDDTGVTWVSDKYYGNKGAVHWVCPADINGTELDSLYCKDRYFNKWMFSSPYRYDIPVPNDGVYSVKLHFAELYYQADGERIFDVLVGGKVVAKNLDIFEKVGYLNALIIPATTISSNGTVSIELVAKKENPKISAIEVIELPNYVFPTGAPVSQVSLPFVSRINAGAAESWLDDNGIFWDKDKYFDSKGAVQNICPLEINGTELDTLYCQYRYFNKWQYKAPFQYDIPVPRNGAYSVKLHFAETHFRARGDRIFDVVVGGKIVMGSLDVYAEVGFAAAFVLPTIIQTSTGFVTIELVSKEEHPTICAIEVLELPDYIAPPTAAPVARPFELLINSGAIAEYLERTGGGRTWMPDKYFIGGGVLFKRHYDIQWTPDDEVFHIERHGEFRYEIPVPTGQYEVLLHLTELHWSFPGQRLFDVAIENHISYKNIDLIKMAGGIRRAFALQSTIPVTDGLLSIEFTNSIPKVDMPKVSGVEIRFISSSTEIVDPFPLFINCGGNGYFENITGISWLSDRFFIGGLTYDRAGTYNIKERVPIEMYRTGRFGPFRYEINAPVGIYDVTLHFAETSLSGNGTRVFNVSLEDTVTFPELDIVALGGGANFLPIVLKSQVAVTDGLLSIAFANLIPDRKNPIVSGIEIRFVGEITKSPMATPTVSPSRAPVLVPIREPVPLPAPIARNCSIPRVRAVLPSIKYSLHNRNTHNSSSLKNLNQLSGNSWSTPYAPYPITVAEPVGEMIGNDFVIFSGFKNGYTNATTETYALDMSTPNAMWKRMDDMPFAQGITHQGLAVIGMKAYLCGGYIGGSLGMHTDHCYVYDHSKPTGQQWSDFTPLPKGGRSGGGMIYDTTLNAIVYAGGSQRAIQGQNVAIDYKDTWMYSFDNPTAGWVQQSNIPFYGNHMSSISLFDKNGKERHFVFGGQVGDYELWGNTATMYEYIAATDTWIQRKSMPFGRGHAGSSVRAVGCGGFLVAGGRTNKGLTGDISYYNVEMDSWQSIGRLPVDIHTNVCVVYEKTKTFRCEAGWATGTFSTEISIEY